jgi:uncharacterized membrane protein YkgB
MEKGYYYCDKDDRYHYVLSDIDRFSHFYLSTKQNKEENFGVNLKKNPKCKPFEWIKEYRKTSILLGVIVILALVSVAVTSNRKRKKKLGLLE